MAGGCIEGSVELRDVFELVAVITFPGVVGEMDVV